MNVPAELKYTKDHEWIRMESDGVAVVGITDFAQSELGELVYIEVDTVGSTVEEGDVFGTVEAVKTTSDLFMPVTGEVLEFNEELTDAKSGAGLINTDPYGAGWIARVRVADPAAVAGLMDAAAYSAHIA